MPVTVSIVGAGRVGRALGERLHGLGWNVGVVVTRSMNSARAAVRAIGAGTAAAGLTSQILGSDVVLICTPDDVIAEVAAKLVHTVGSKAGEKEFRRRRCGELSWRGKTVLHTSGALDATVLAALARAGAATGSLHPMQTFRAGSTAKVTGLLFGISGSPRAVKVARQLARQMGGMPVRLSGTNKAAYHVTGIFACAHVLALLETGTRILAKQGVTRSQAAKALLHLTRQTLDNFEHAGPRSAWTGPMARGDYETVKRHMNALAGFPREYGEAYKAVSRLAAVVLPADPKTARARLDRVFIRRATNNK